MRGIRGRILLGFLFVVILMIGYAGYSIWNVQQTNQEIAQLQEEEVPLLMTMERMAFNVANRLALSRGYLLMGNAQYVEEFQQLTDESRELEEWLLQNTEDEVLHHLVSKTREWQTIMVDEVFPAQQNGDEDEAMLILLSRGTSPAQQLMRSFQEQSELNRDALATKLNEINSKGSQLQMTTIWISIAVTVLSIMSGLLIASMIVRPINVLLGRVNIIASGDLTGEEIPVKKKDEIGQLTMAFNSMRDNLRDLLSKTTNMSEQVAATAEQLSASSQETSAATNQIAVTIQEVSSASEQTLQRSQESTQSALKVNEGVEMITEATTGVSTLAEEASREAKEGEASISRAVSQISTIRETVSQSADFIQQLGERSHEIGNILELITSISEQTNLLALNAAIEAARAGEHGKGFAVVADEVRKLAEESRASAEKISTMILLIQEDTERAVEEMNRGTEEVEVGTKVVHEVGESFTRISDAVERVSKEMSHVTTATEQISLHTNRLNEALSEMEAASEQNADASQGVAASTEEQLASMEEIASSAEALNHLSTELQEEVSKFKI
ncbi:methyl-accepting chemotaxis protein [Halalkalibacter oceani]|uniref:Methyl-accepting chemotaxis protein n=1 Tax=Halalkalibacter oceani TaxID=1653776 RepID=A0A9X2DNU6_9BACI|nr:methyl-accepting chemotaxis protein [Halalkalibacter oceani]MCM3714179.1 methyl-accepting chemotaxis protein [Halalkalibacter oceani]